MSSARAAFQELVTPQEVVLGEDLASLQKLPERTRIERYNTLKANEEEFLWEFNQDHPEFLTSAERDQVRSRFRLARLKLAASLYDEGTLPPPLEEDFIDQELQAVVDFDRYKKFDALSEDQIEEKIRRMEGEVYELVTEYHSTQLADLHALLDDPDVQQDVMEALLEEYEERFEKVRQGFFIYVEHHGLEHLVETIEDAVRAISDARDERSSIRAALEEELEALEASVEGLPEERHALEAQLQDVEGRLASPSADLEAIRSDLEKLTERRNAIARTCDDAIEAVDGNLEQIEALRDRIDAQIGDLESVRSTADANASDVDERAVALLEDELEALQTEREELRAEKERLEAHREGIAADRERLGQRQADLEERIDRMESSFAGDEDGVRGLPAEAAVTASLARVLEMDYLGRFDITMHEAEAIHLPEEDLEPADGYWDDRSETRSEWARVLGEDEDVDPAEFPANRAARYEITDSRYFGLGRETRAVIEAVVVSHLGALTTNGFDTAPAGIDDLLRYVEDAVYESEQDDVTYILGVASPTGWTDRVREEIMAGGGDDGVLSHARFGRNVSVVLVDLQDGSLYYDEADAVAADNAQLFEPPVHDDRLETCVGTIREEYLEDVAHEHVLLRELVEDHDYAAPVVKLAFDELEAEGVGEQLVIDEYGLSLDFGAAV
jgi:predicted  nucleic acid-binding Zn-ribbon protein